MYYQNFQRSLVCKDTIFRFIQLLLISIFLVCPTEIYAQNSLISISVKNVSLKELLTSIEKQSDVRFSYIEKISITKKILPSASRTNRLKGYWIVSFPVKEWNIPGQEIQLQSNLSSYKRINRKK